MMDNGDGKAAEAKDCGPTENETIDPTPPMPPVHEVLLIEECILSRKQG